MVLTHHGINSLSRVQLYDLLYADANGKKHFVNPDAIPSPLPAGWELVGDVAILKGNKATILYKTENTSVKWASMWLFKVDGLKLDGTDSFVLQQGPATGSTPVEVGTFTATAAATDLDTLVSELDTWLRANPTATGALANYDWHAEKHADADGVDACFIVVDNLTGNSRFAPIKSSTSGASSVLYMWDFAGITENYGTIRRKDGVDTANVIYNKERFKAVNTSTSGASDSLTSTGIYNEDGFDSSVVIKGFYGTYDNYLDNMVPDEEATAGAYAYLKGKSKEIAKKLQAVFFKNLAGTETAVFAAQSYAAGLKAHSTASVEGLNLGDFFVPSMDIMYKIFSVMKINGSDAINSALVAAGSSKYDIDKYRWITARATADNTVWIEANNGIFAGNAMFTNPRAVVVAEINL